MCRGNVPDSNKDGSSGPPVLDVLLSKLASAWHLMSIWTLSTTFALAFDKETADGRSVPLHSNSSCFSAHVCPHVCARTAVA